MITFFFFAELFLNINNHNYKYISMYLFRNTYFFDFLGLGTDQWVFMRICMRTSGRRNGLNLYVEVSLYLIEDSVHLLLFAQT